MKKTYEPPMLYTDEFAPDTMIASGGGEPSPGPKNDNAGNNQNCWGARNNVNQIVGDHVCLPGLPAGC